MRLQNLSDLIDQSRKKFFSLPYKSDIQLDLELKDKLETALKLVDNKATCDVKPFSIEFETSDKLKALVPSSALWYADAFFELSNQLNEYQQTLNIIKGKLKDLHGYATADVNNFLKKLPSKDLASMSEQISLDFKSEVNNVLSNQNDRDFFIEYCSDRKWWFKPMRQTEAVSGKSLERTDFTDSSLALACGVIVSNSSKLITVIKAFGISPSLRSCFASKVFEQYNFSGPTPSSETVNSVAGKNVIFYGAPGTGKSYKINKLCTIDNSMRTVFHPDTQNSDFVGCLKPVMDGEDIIYSFRPGPFCLSLKLAHENQNENVFLIIEEINRAAAAAVFGEVFQLLDREPSGVSTYSIVVSDPDMLKYLKEDAPSVLNEDKLKIPLNLNLYATMNSSDQAVMPMDTAFKRRWEFEYISIDFSKTDAGPEGTIPILFSDGNEQDISWQIFASSINEILEKAGIPEDRLLGPWFLSDSEIKDADSAIASLKGKLLLYLWDDVLRHNKKTLLFSSSVGAFSSLIKFIKAKKPIFSNELEELLKKALPNSSENIEESRGPNSNTLQENAQPESKV